ncbi:UNVERIFIED_CONTAM: Triacylglycerol lipase 2 [Sesamum angustifolium]|uniref:Triacylglycerol lipase 2 n=1 Tax=Sesamum angustifolium TaxID=2727405 RepID=A0AAW2PI17_9LAMI
MYDYGDVKENVKHYGMAVPPSYNMTNIPNDVPLFLAYGGKDALSVQEDVKLLLDSLHQHEQDKLVVQYIENYAHADFIMGFNARQVVNDPLMAFLKLH